jgi:DNA repair exonuclease SbcCD nuclease subunit
MRFVHTADWQLGMTRHFLAGEAQPRYSAARRDVVAGLGSLAAEVGAEFVVWPVMSSKTTSWNPG